ncbi:MAG: FAD-dependent thymidylate synthase [Acidobacteria bacterium]|nr:FAD-dependent thymidylate synthase [Acidobacteriota bacterium]
MSDERNLPTNETEVYAIHGADPEALAYAMAKYSRSALSLKESLREISSQRAEEFLNTFYFQYGHRSIADLAHVAFAVEKLSLLAAIELVDEQRWDGQERSTRYQNFRKSGYYTPQFASEKDRERFAKTADALFVAYEQVGNGMLEELKEHTPKPAEMDEAAYTRTLKARAFDMARYLLPLATNTSLGQITNARTLEGQISRLLGSEHAEVRRLGERLKEAASGSAWNNSHAGLQRLIEELPESARAKASEVLLREVKVSPTLVKYTTPSEYAKQSAAELEQAANELLRGAEIASKPMVDLVGPHAGERYALEIDLAASLLYPHCHYSYRQIREAVAALAFGRIEEIIALGTKHRGRHDELPRAFSAAQGFRFDILMDIGGFRDMHRHRRCTQLLQKYTDAHGYEVPDFPSQPAMTKSRVAGVFSGAMKQAFAAYESLGGCGTRTDGAEKHAHSSAGVHVPQFGEGGVQLQRGSASPSKANPDAAYVLPLATRCRSLFTMDFAEALYISELRSGVAGHWSYRRVAWEMYEAVKRAHPELARHFRIKDVYEPVDLLKR